MYPLFSALTRSKEKVELESSSPAASEEEVKTKLEYDKGLEALCEELQATLDGLVRPEDAVTSLPLRPSGTVWGCLTVEAFRTWRPSLLLSRLFRLPDKSLCSHALQDTLRDAVLGHFHPSGYTE